ncbi:MAG TPA: SpoIVB peptidase S55 domain-containing protein, partial [Isosphaeraceae bacterium]|nr:SpoIVB peptidase S55 domain-containing protein [Isosphaeraceae bacterium]
MKGTGRTVMVGTKLEEFSVEVLGVMRDVSPGRDMILCRLSGCNLEHAGIIQGMSGSPIYIEGKLVGAVAFAWEFAKDPIAGVTPFSQMVQYVRANDRRIAAERKKGPSVAISTSWAEALENRDAGLPALGEAKDGPVTASGGGLAGMRPIATPLAASGFSPRALSLLSERLGPLGLAPMAGGGATREVLEREGDKPLVPGSPVSVGMVTGDFDLSGIGTVTHVEGDRVYAFGHPMMGLGACELPMMTGYIHTVYPRSSVSMKLGSPLKVVGVLDTDVSTAVSGRLGAKPDMLPVSVSVRNGPYAETHTYHVQIVRQPTMLPTLLLSTLTNALDTEGELPAQLTARIVAEIRLKGHEPIELKETLSGARYSGPMGASSLFGPIVSTVGVLVHNPLEPVRIESIDCRVEIQPGEQLASVESVRLASDEIEPGQTLRALVTLKPNLGARETVELSLPIPRDFP